MATIVDVHHGNVEESWIVVEDDGRIVYHSENDGPAFLRKGPQAVDREIDLTEVARLESTHPSKNILARVQAALAAKRP